MILVTLGTQDKSFERLLIEVENLINQKVIKEEVVVQAGYTQYSSNKMKIFDYLPRDEFQNLIGKCRCLITHGGVGSIFDGLESGKKVIAVPRYSKYMEHTNDHQVQVVTELGKEGYILPCLEVSDLNKSLKKLRNFHPATYSENRKLMISVIRRYIRKKPDSLIFSSIFQYFDFGIVFILLQYLFFYLGSFHQFSGLGYFLITWVVSYFFTLWFFFTLYHNHLKFRLRKQLLIFSFICCLIHFSLFLLFKCITSFFICIISSGVLSLLLGYIIFMLVFGGDNLFGYRIKNTVKKSK